MIKGTLKKKTRLLQRIVDLSSYFYFFANDYKKDKILNFLYFCHPFFFPFSHCFIGWSKINLKVYGIINCLNKNLMTHCWYPVWYLDNMFDILRRKKGMALKLCQLIESWIRNIFTEKSSRICVWKLVPDPFLMLINNLKHPLHPTISLKNKMFWKRKS